MLTFRLVFIIRTFSLHFVSAALKVLNPFLTLCIYTLNFIYTCLRYSKEEHFAR